MLRSKAQCDSWYPLRLSHRRQPRKPTAFMIVCFVRSTSARLSALSILGMVVSKLCALPAYVQSQLWYQHAAAREAVTRLVSK